MADLPENFLSPIIERRAAATLRIINALRHLPYDRQITIITSYIPIDELEEIAGFQENRDT